MHYNYLKSGGAISLTLGGEGELMPFSGIFLYGDPGGTGPASVPLSLPMEEQLHFNLPELTWPVLVHLS